MKKQHFLNTVILFIFINFYGSSYAMEQTEQIDTIIAIDEQPEQEQTGWFNSLLKPFNGLLKSLHLRLWTQLEEDFIIQILEQDSFNKEDHIQLLNDALLESIRFNQIEKIINIITLVHQKFPQDSTLIQTNTARLIHNCITDYQQDYILTMNHYISDAQTEIPPMLKSELNLIKRYLQYSIDTLHTYKKNHDQKFTDFYDVYKKCKQTTRALHAISDIDKNNHISLNYCSDEEEENNNPLEKIQFNHKKYTKLIENLKSVKTQLTTMNNNILLLKNTLNTQKIDNTILK